MTSRGEAIKLRGVSKFWGATPAVQDLSIDVAAGSFTVLLGPSGCGKSTSLRIIAGLEAADEGAVLIGERDVTRLSPASRDLAMVFQSYALFPHLSVAENIAFGLKVRGVGRAEREARLDRTADLLGLSHLLARKPSQLSGGQQQRVALGRAIIAEKPICLMDEPLSNLDAKLRHDMRVEIRGLQQKLGFTMVYVTHDQVEAISMADQVVLLNEGRVEQAATPRQIYETPASPFVARFIGTPPMNLVPAQALAAGMTDGVAAKNNAGAAGADAGAAEAETGTETGADGLLVGLRPEEVRLTDGPGLKAKIISIEYLGADTLIECAIGATPFLVRVGGALALAVEDTITLTWAATAVHLFDSGSGRRRDGLEQEIRPFTWA